MENVPEIPADWTAPERWVWEQIASGMPADLYGREPDSKGLEPGTGKGWGKDRRLSATFLQTILTQNEFVEATPFGGVRIRGALIDDAPLNLENARLQHLFWLEKSRILIGVNCLNLRIDGELSLKDSFVATAVNLMGADIRESALLSGSTFEGDVNLNHAMVSGSVYLRGGATFKGELDLGAAKIAGNLEMGRSTFEGDVNLNGAMVSGSVNLRGGATFKGRLSLVAAKIGSNLETDGSTFEGEVNLNSATVSGSVHLRSGATFKGMLELSSSKIGSTLQMNNATFEGDVFINRAAVDGSVFLNDSTLSGALDLMSARIGSQLIMVGSNFEKDVNLSGATVNGAALLRDASFEGQLFLVATKIGINLEMDCSTFEGYVNLSSATVSGAVFLRDGATFKDELVLSGAKIGTTLEMYSSTFEGPVDLTGCTVTGDLLLGFSEDSVARWKDGASLTLGNAHVGVLRDWWRDSKTNSWPKTYQLEGFTYDRLSSIAMEPEADMLGRPVDSYIQWLKGDPGSSPQPYEHLADRFHEAGEPHKATDILYAARERRRRKAWTATKDEHGNPKRREWQLALGLSVLCLTIGYGLGIRYFRILWSVGFFTLVGALLLILNGSYPVNQWLGVVFASLDQLLPIITLDKTHDVLIFGDPSGKPYPVAPQPYWVKFYFYVHTILGWVLGSFLVAGLGGLTQRN